MLTALKLVCQDCRFQYSIYGTGATSIPQPQSAQLFFAVIAYLCRCMYTMCCSGQHFVLCCTGLPAWSLDLCMATYVICFAYKCACVQSSYTRSALPLTQGTSAMWPMESMLMLLPGLCLTALCPSLDTGHQAVPGLLCCRLPPIERRWTAGMTRDAFMNRGYTFQCPAWQQCKLHQVLLTKVSVHSRCTCTFHS